MRMMNIKIQRVGEWMRSNYLTLNYKKCNYIIFKRKQRPLHEITTDLFIGDTKLEKLKLLKINIWE